MAETILLRMEARTMNIIMAIFTDKTNFIYVLLSLLGMYINFNSLKKRLNPESPIHHIYTIVTSMILPVFHLYVFNFGIIPFLDIDISDNIPLYYISFGLSFLSLFPYIVARRLYR